MADSRNIVLDLCDRIEIKRSSDQASLSLTAGNYLPQMITHTHLKRYLTAVLVCFAAILLAKLFSAPVLWLLIAVIISSRFCGRAPTVLSASVSSIALAVFLLSHHGLGATIFRVSLFLVASILVYLDEAALCASEERWNSLAENLSAGIALIAPGGRFIKANLALQEMLGYTEYELQGRTVIDITYEEDRAATEARLADFYKGQRRGYRVEKRYLRKDGGVMWADASSILVPATGSSSAFLAVTANAPRGAIFQFTLPIQGDRTS